MRKRLAVLIIVLLVGQGVWADHTCVIGGLRSGLALGMSVDHHLTENTWGRFEVAGTTGEDFSFTGDNPFVAAADLRTHVATLGPQQVRLSVGLGLVGIYGIRTEQGSFISAMFENIYGMEPLLLELGFDYFGDHGHATAQLGYRIY